MAAVEEVALVRPEWPRCTGSNVVARGLCEEKGFFSLTKTSGDLTVSTNTTPQQMAELLVPSWVTVTNVVYTGSGKARGTFSGGNGCGLPIDSGIMLSSGNITNALGPNAWPDIVTPFFSDGDSDLDRLVGDGETTDAALLEFDIIATNSFVWECRYIYASDEYPEYIDTFNDPMAIFVSTNRVSTNWIISVSNNLAIVPGVEGLPVSVGTINGGDSSDTDPADNPQYYVDNRDPVFSSLPQYAASGPVFNIEYDGMTVVLTAQTYVDANVTNHIKIGVADFDYGGIEKDWIIDTTIFLEAWSTSPCP